MGRTLVVVAVTAGLAVVAAACGSSDTTTAVAEDEASTESDVTPAAETAAPEEESPTPTAALTPTAEPEPTPTVGPTPEPEPATTLPLSEDPCTDPAEHEIGTDPTEYTFELAGADRPVGIIVGEDALTGDSTFIEPGSPPDECAFAHPVIILGSAGLADRVAWERHQGCSDATTTGDDEGNLITTYGSCVNTLVHVEIRAADPLDATIDGIAAVQFLVQLTGIAR